MRSRLSEISSRSTPSASTMPGVRGRVRGRIRVRVRVRDRVGFRVRVRVRVGVSRPARCPLPR